MYFNAITNDDNNVTVTVEGGGVNATLEIPDIAVTNGFVHIIDHVLGIPYATVQEKLATDPMLKWVWKRFSKYFFSFLVECRRCRKRFKLD